MRTPILALLLTGACASRAAAPAAPAAAALHGPQIKLASIYVDDLDKARQFYTDVVGFVVKDDVKNGQYRWLTVTAPDDRTAELHLALDDNPAAKAYQEAMFAEHQPAAMFYTDDVRADYARLQAHGAVFTMAPTEVMAGSVIAVFDDTSGNLIQLTQLAS